MKKWTALPLLLALILSGLLFSAVYYLLKPDLQVSALSQDEVKARIEELYQGEVKKIKAKDDTFYVEMAHSNGMYEIEMTKSGEIQTIRWLEQNTETKEQPVEKEKLTIEELRSIVLSTTGGTIQSMDTIDSERMQVVVTKESETITLELDRLTGEILQQTAKPKEKQKPQRISEKKAIELAKKIVNGKVVGSRLDSKGNTSFYLIEIKTDDDIAIVQIHAITGKHLSTTWMDDDDYDDGDDDDDDDEDSDDDDDD